MLFSDFNNLIMSQLVEAEANILQSMNGKLLIEILIKTDPSMKPCGTSEIISNNLL